MMIFRLLILSIEMEKFPCVLLSIGVSKSKLQSGRYFPFDCLAVTLLQSPLRPKEMENRTWHSDSETQPELLSFKRAHWLFSHGKNRNLWTVRFSRFSFRAEILICPSFKSMLVASCKSFDISACWLSGWHIHNQGPVNGTVQRAKIIPT